MGEDEQALQLDWKINDQAYVANAAARSGYDGTDEIVLHVPADATNAYAGLLLVGTGTAHAPALKIDIVPDTTPTTGE